MKLGKEGNHGCFMILESILLIELIENMGREVRYKQFEISIVAQLVGWRLYKVSQIKQLV